MAAVPLRRHDPPLYASLFYADGRSAEVAIVDPPPVTIAERLSADPGSAGQTEGGHRRFALIGRDLTGALRYAEFEVIPAGFRCGRCGGSPELAYAPRPRDLVDVSDNFPERGRPAWLLCDRCYGVAVRLRPGATHAAGAGETVWREARRARRASGPTRRWAADVMSHGARDVEAHRGSSCGRADAPAVLRTAQPAPPPARRFTPEEVDEIAERVGGLVARVDPLGLAAASRGTYHDQALALALSIEPGVRLSSESALRHVRAAFGRDPEAAAPAVLESAFALIAAQLPEELSATAVELPRASA